MLNNLKMRKKLLLLSVPLILLICLVGFIGSYFNSKANNQMEEMYKKRLLPISWLTDARNQARANDADLLKLITYSDKSSTIKMDDVVIDVNTRLTALDTIFANYEKVAESSYEKENLIKLKQNYTTYKQNSLKIVGLVKKNEIEQAKVMFEQIQTDSNAFHQNLKDLGNYNTQLADKVYLQNEIDNKASNTSMLVVIILAVLLSTLIVFLIVRAIVKPLNSSISYCSALAKGDFSNSLPVKYTKFKDEIGDLARALDTMHSSIKNMIVSVKESSNKIDLQSESLSSVAQQMSASSEEVTNAIQNVAEGTGSQAEDLAQVVNTLNNFGEELEGIVTSISDMDENSKEISTMANESNDNMTTLSASVGKISEAFTEFTGKISKLGQSINQINDITNLINSIADQTNLLALNASIEAARAGEAGKGFAVVADEIRKLAEQVKTSSDNINQLITGVSSDTNQIIRRTDVMNEELGNQVSIINTTVNSFEKIIKAVDVIVPKIANVNNSAESLSSQKDSILERIEGVSSIAEEVSASSEEIAASSEEMSASTQEVASSVQSLSSMTKKMMDQVDMFKL